MNKTNNTNNTNHTKNQEQDSKTGKRTDSLLRRITRLPLKTITRIAVSILVCVLALFLIVQTLLFSNSLKTLRTELRQIKANTDVSQETFTSIEGDMNTVQRILSLPESHYVSKESEEESTTPALTEFSELFSAVDTLRDLSNVEKSFRDFEALIQSQSFDTLLKRYGLSATLTQTGAYEIHGNDLPFVRLHFDDEEFLTVEPFFSYLQPVRIALTSGNLVQRIENVLSRVITKKTALERSAALIRDHLFTESLLVLRREQGVTLHESQLTEEGITIQVKKNRQEVEPIQVFAETLAVGFLQKSYPSSKEFIAATTSIFSQEIPSFKELETKRLQALLLEKLSDSGFQSYLQQNDFKLSTEFREEDEFYYLDIISQDNGSKAGSIAINRYNNRIWLHDKDDIPLRELRLESLYSQAFVQEDAEAQVILLAGSHEDLTDTMIVAYCNDSGIYMFSVPRDIYYEERRLNTYFRDFGNDGLLRAVETIIGIKINHVVVVDMYAFIEVINTLGGIEVSLEQDLIDPTYRVKNGAIWSTLYYPKGKHYLNGVEALRIVRSRHTSSDFSRSERQKRVLVAIQQKIETLGLSALLSSSDSFIRLLSLVSTDMNVLDAIRIASTYAKKPILGITVLSTKNVLFSTYSALLAEPAIDAELPEETASDSLEDSSKAQLITDSQFTGTTLDTSILATSPVSESLALQQVTEPSESLGLWILLPKNNDWSIIRSFIRSKIEKVGV